MYYKIAPRNHFGKEPFAFWENFLNDDDIKKILLHKNWKNLEKASVSVNNIGSKINKKIRDTKISWMDVSQDTLDIWQKINTTFSEVNRRFFNFDLDGFYEPAQLGLYTSKDKSHYDWHIDYFNNGLGVPRKLSMVLSLSDSKDFTGGDLLLKPHTDESIKVELKKGRAWFFPSYVLHTVTPVTKGIRKSLVVWAGGPDFR